MFAMSPTDRMYLSLQKFDSIVAVVSEFSKQMTSHASHFFLLRNQFREIRHVRENLEEDELLLHIDFSENYAEQSSVEVQASHFGAHNQIVIHQGVLYMKVRKITFVNLSFII
jgi:hypothetical protein